MTVAQATVIALRPVPSPGSRLPAHSPRREAAPLAPEQPARVRR